MVMMEIRKAKKGDLKKIAEIFKKEYAKQPYNEKWSDDTSFNSVKQYYEDSEIFVAEVNKTIIGFIIFSEFTWDEGKMGSLSEVVVNSEEQGKGVGKALINFMEEWFKKRGIKKIRLMAVAKSKALKIYEKIDYERIKKYIIMEKNLRK